MTETTTETVEYDLSDVPVVAALRLLNVELMGLDGTDTDEQIRESAFAFYTNKEDNAPETSLFDAGWERGVERKNLSLAEALEMSEDYDLNDDEARSHYLYGYLAGQIATYEEWETPYAKTSDDEFFENQG